jgi:hypothetical protein
LSAHAPFYEDGTFITANTPAAGEECWSELPSIQDGSHCSISFTRMRGFLDTNTTAREMANAVIGDFTALDADRFLASERDAEQPVSGARFARQ